MVTIALGIGLLLNQLQNEPLPLIPHNAATPLYETPGPILDLKTIPAGPRLVAEVTLPEFKAFVDQQRGPVIDARPEVFHRIGHVPGALSLPRDDFKKAYSNLRDLLERDKERSMVVYCSGPSCEDSVMVQQTLSEIGYAHVSVFRGGWAAWSEAGFPEERSQ